MEHAPWGEWEGAEIIKEDPTKEIAKLKQQPGKDIVIWGSLMLARSLGEAGLIDEYQLRVCPAALGNGIGIFPESAGNLKLKLLEAKVYDEDMVLLRYKSE